LDLTLDVIRAEFAHVSRPLRNTDSTLAEFQLFQKEMEHSAELF